MDRVESHLHPEPSFDLTKHPMPTGLEEIWRFTPLQRFSALLEPAAQVSTLDWQASLPDGVTITERTAEEARELSVDGPVDRISAIAADQTTRHTHIDIPADLELDEPVSFTATGSGGVASDHYLITVGNHASVTIVIHLQGSGAYSEKVDVVTGDGANVNLVFVQDWDADAVHGGQRNVMVGRDANVKVVTATMGGSAIRLAERFNFAGPGGNLEVYGIYFVDADEHVQHRVFVDHTAPRCSSDVDYRGALQGKGAHSVWVGDVLLRKIAQGITTFESNKNLVLTDGCRADSVPNLEIETGDVEDAGHASSTGRFDDEQLFYLKSRGIPEDEARRLIVHGFFWDIIRRVGVPAIEERLLAQVEAELDKAATAKAAGAQQ